MIRAIRAYLVALAAALEKFAAELSEDAKRYPERQFYRGYEQGFRDGQANAEHAREWVSLKDAVRAVKRQQFPNE